MLRTNLHIFQIGALAKVLFLLVLFLSVSVSSRVDSRIRALEHQPESSEKDNVNFGGQSTDDKAEAADPSAVRTGDAEDEKTQTPVKKSKMSKVDAFRKRVGKGRLKIVDNENNLIDGVQDKYAKSMLEQEQFYKKQRKAEEKEKKADIKAEEKIKYYKGEVLDRKIQEYKIQQEEAEKIIAKNKAKTEEEASKRYEKAARKKANEEEKKRPLRVVRFKFAQDFCLNLYKNRRVEGGEINLWKCTTGNNQNWRFWEDSTIRLANDNKWCVQLKKSAVGPQNGAKIELGACKVGKAEQRWIVRDDHTIRYGADTSFGFDLKRGINSNGNPIHLWKIEPNFNQRWVLADPASDGHVYKLLNIHVHQHRQMCMNLHNNEGKVGATTNVWKCNNHISQRWQIWKDKSIRVGWKVGYCLGVKGQKPEENALIQLEYCGGKPGKFQKWHRFGNALYLDADRSFVIDVQDGAYTESGKNLVLRKRSGKDGFLWTIHTLD